MKKGILKSENRDSNKTGVRRRSSSGSTNSSSNEDDIGVGFDDVTVYEFPTLLGDNPAVTNGSPLTIDWVYEKQYNMDINLYEFMRSQYPRKTRKQLVMKCGERDAQ
jgi:hypothetical protein